MKSKLNLVLALALVLTLSFVSAHKDAPESAQSDYAYRVYLGLNPIHSTVGADQEIYFRVEDYIENAPVPNLKARFILYKDVTAHVYGSDELYTRSPDDRVGNYVAYESEPGIYSAGHVFDEVGTYILVARLYDESQSDIFLIKEIQQRVHVEPNGPSALFWSFMIVSILLGAAIASRSHLE